MTASLVPIDIPPGINLEADNTKTSSFRCVDADRMRFRDGRWESIGGWESIATTGVTLAGCPRKLAGVQTTTQQWVVVGTHSKLHALLGSTLYNITPLKTATVSLPSDPVATTNTSDTVTITTSSAHGLAADDRVKLAALATTNGVPDTDLNKEHIVASVPTTTTFTIAVATAASSTGSGGGASGTVQFEIDAGLCDASLGRGYGMGKYGVGRYGIVKFSTSTLTSPRVWAMDMFGSLWIGTPGGGTGLYEWDMDTAEAPALVSNAPTAINYAFVTDNIIVTFGDTDEDKLRWCAQGDRTDWTASAGSSKAGSRRLRGMGRLICHLSVPGGHLILSETATQFLRYIGGNFVFDTSQRVANVGIAGPNAGVPLPGGGAMWMAQNNFYLYNGGAVQPVPCSLWRTVFLDSDTAINWTQRAKVVTWYNARFNEFWCLYPSGASDEVNRAVFCNLGDISNWYQVQDIDRTAADGPQRIFDYPLLASSGGTLYRHEKGVNADGAALSAYVETAERMLGNGDRFMDLDGLIPDSVQDGAITVTPYTRDWPQGVETSHSAQTAGTGTERIDLTITARVVRYRFEQSGAGSQMRLGRWLQEVKPASMR